MKKVRFKLQMLVFATIFIAAIIFMASVGNHEANEIIDGYKN